MKVAAKSLYANNCGDLGSVNLVHKIVVNAIKKDNGKLPEEFSDMFTLTKAPEGSAVDWVLNWA